MNFSKTFYILSILFVTYAAVSAQHTVTIDGVLDEESKILSIQQEITYTNTSNDTLKEIFLHDWANSFSSKTTPLGKSFSEDFVRKFYFAKDHERGATTIESITDESSRDLTWNLHCLLYTSPSPRD